MSNIYLAVCRCGIITSFGGFRWRTHLADEQTYDFDVDDISLMQSRRKLYLVCAGRLSSKSSSIRQQPLEERFNQTHFAPYESQKRKKIKNYSIPIHNKLN